MGFWYQKKIFSNAESWYKDDLPIVFFKKQGGWCFNQKVDGKMIFTDY